MSKINIDFLHKFNEDDEWYTTKEDVEYFINNIIIPKDKVIWCPFDKDSSNFVRVLREYGYKVINSHIDYGQDFYNYEPQEHYDLIMSNPPFKGKYKLLQRLKQLNKPFALIFSNICFNTGKFNRVLGTLNRVQFIILERRMKFVKDVDNYDIKKIKQPTFHCLWICNNMFDRDLVFLEGFNYSSIKKKV